jgi:inhibitor of KinA sporulation pathway (predicted exonuclease)
MGHRKLLVVDLEATCWARDRHVQEDMETIEIGAILFDPFGGEPEREYQAFVQPTLFPILSDFCTQLTTIQQSDVNSAPHFAEALRRFVEWLGDPRQVRFASWGDYDRRQIARDCQRAGVEVPFEPDTLNLKHICCPRLHMKPGGMAQALARAGLELGGTHHRALDDARNILRLAQRTLGADWAGVMASPPALPPELRPRPPSGGAAR